MEKNIVVVYKSEYGTAKQYAAWIAEELSAKLMDRKNATPEKLQGFDCVIYGGGLYGPAGIAGVDFVAKNHFKNLVVFTVGLADPAITDYSPILAKNFPPDVSQPIKVFHLRGGIDYKKLGIVHRGMMAMMKKMTIGKKPYEELKGDEKLLADTYGGKADFTDRSAIAPLVKYVQELNICKEP